MKLFIYKLAPLSAALKSRLSSQTVCDAGFKKLGLKVLKQNKTNKPNNSGKAKGRKLKISLWWLFVVWLAILKRENTPASCNVWICKALCK